MSTRDDRLALTKELLRVQAEKRRCQIRADFVSLCDMEKQLKKAISELKKARVIM